MNTLKRKTKAALLGVVTIAGLVLTGCQQTEEWIEVEVVSTHTHGGSFNDTYDHTIVRDLETNEVYRIKGHAWAEIEGPFKVNRNGRYFFD